MCGGDSHAQSLIRRFLASYEQMLMLRYAMATGKLKPICTDQGIYLFFLG